MGGKSDFLENYYLNHIYKSAEEGMEIFSTDDLQIALYTVAPTDAGGGVEVAGEGYQRAVVPNQDYIHREPPVPITWDAAVDGVKRNAVPIEFAQAGAGGWGIIVAFAIFTGEGAIMFHWGAVDPPVEVTEGDVFRIPTGGLVISED